MNGLKRKRSYTEEYISQLDDPLQPARTDGAEPTPKRRKITTVVSKFVRTAAVATMGAFMAWYALASVPE